MCACDTHNLRDADASCAGTASALLGAAERQRQLLDVIDCDVTVDDVKYIGFLRAKECLLIEFERAVRAKHIINQCMHCSPADDAISAPAA